MKTATKTFMTIAVMGSLILGTVAVSSAELSKVVSTQRNQASGLDDILNSPFGGDGDPDPTHCKKKGKVIYLRVSDSSTAFVTIQSSPGQNKVTFWFDDPGNASTHILWDFLKEAWLQKFDVEVSSSDGPCIFDEANDYTGDWYDGGKIAGAGSAGPIPAE